MVKKTSHLWIIVGLLLVMWGILLFRVDWQFFGHHESGFIWISSGIKVFNEYGPAAASYLPIRTPGPTDPETGLYYLHHPPLIFWFSAIAGKLFGTHSDTLAPYESSLRLVGIIATIITLPMFYTLVRKLTSARIALVGIFIYAFCPVTMYFGRMPYYDMLVMPVILAFAYHFVLWMEHHSMKRALILMALGVFAMWIAWAAAFFFFVFGVIALIYGKRQQRIGIFAIGAVIGLATIAIPILYYLLREEAIQQLIDIVALRTSNHESDLNSDKFTLGEFLIQYINHMLTMLSLSTVFLGFIGIVYTLTRKKTLSVAIQLGLVAAPLIFMAIAKNSWNFHDWYKLHFLPGFALAAAVVIVTGWELEPAGIKKYAKPFIVAILICSAVPTLLWFYQLHQTTHDEFARTAAEQLPEYTGQDDFIATNYDIRTNPIVFYAYRNIRWAITVDNLLEYYEAQETLDMYYLLCLDEGEDIDSYEGPLSEYDYEIIGGRCRIIHLVKPVS